MRYALVSDIHANLQAWRAVDKDIRNHGADTVLCLGDLIGYGPDPEAVLEAVYSRATATVVGNHDAVIAGTLDASIFNDEAKRLIEWTADQLGDDAASYFADLPYKMSDGNMLCVHAEAINPGRFDYVINDAIAKANFDAVDNRVIFLGHTHMPGIFEQSPGGEVDWLPPRDLNLRAGYRYIVNVGSVGDPRDNNPRASYCLFDAATDQLAFRRVKFDYDSYRSRIASTGINTSPRCLITLDQGVATLRDTQPLREMAIKPQTSEREEVTTASTRVARIRPTTEKQPRSKRPKFGKPAKRLRRNRSDKPTATSAATSPTPPADDQPQASATGLWLWTVAALLLLSLGGVFFATQWSKRPEPVFTDTPPPKPPTETSTVTETPALLPVAGGTSPATAPAVPPAAVAEALNPFAETTIPAPAKAIVNFPAANWQFDDGSLTSDVDTELTIDGPHQFVGDKNQRRLVLQDSTVSIAAPAGAAPPVMALRFWLKLDDAKHEQLATLGGAQLRILQNGKLQLTRGDEAETAKPNLDLTRWHHYVLTRNMPGAGRYQPAIRLYVNGTRLITLPGAKAASGPITPIQLQRLRAHLADVSISPTQWSAKRSKADFAAGLQRLQIDPPPAAATAAKTSAEAESWTLATAIPPSNLGRPLQILGPARLAEGSPALILPRGASVVIPPPALDERDRFTMRFWFRSPNLADRPLLRMGRMVLGLRDQRLQLIDGDNAGPLHDTPLKPDVWYAIIFGRAIGANHNRAISYGILDDGRKLQQHNVDAFPPTAEIHFTSEYNGMLGPLRYDAKGPHSTDLGAKNPWYQLAKTLANAEVPDALPIRRWPTRYDGSAIDSLANEANGGPKLQLGPGIAGFDNGSDNALYLGPQGAAAKLVLPSLNNTAVGSTLLFRFKSSGRPGLLCRYNDADNPLAVVLNDQGILTIFVADEPVCNAPVKRGKWHRFVLSTDANGGSAFLDQQQLFSQDDVEKLPPPQARVRFGAAVNGRTAEALLTTITQLPYRLSPEELQKALQK